MKGNELTKILCSVLAIGIIGGTCYNAGLKENKENKENNKTNVIIEEPKTSESPKEETTPKTSQLIIKNGIKPHGEENPKKEYTYNKIKREEPTTSPQQPQQPQQPQEQQKPQQPQEQQPQQPQEQQEPQQPQEQQEPQEPQEPQQNTNNELEDIKYRINHVVKDAYFNGFFELFHTSGNITITSRNGNISVIQGAILEGNELDELNARIQDITNKEFTATFYHHVSEYHFDMRGIMFT